LVKEQINFGYLARAMNGFDDNKQFNFQGG